jgi:enamine deaminase RidA (YjgF/YER057c/UK114 family)
LAREVFFPYPNNKPVGFSPVARVGKQIFVAGQVANDANGVLVGVGDARAQTEQCFKNVEAALQAAGAGWDDVTKITCFLVNADDYAAYAEVRNGIFPENGPASSTVIVTALVRPEMLVEVEAYAVLQ